MNLRKNFFRFFPPPNYLLQPAVGLDISDRSIKFLKFGLRKGDIFLDKFGEKEIPAGIIEDGKIKGKKELISVLSKWRKESSLDRVIVSLPEDQAFVFKMKVPEAASGHIRENIELHLEEYIPLLPTETTFDYEIISTPTQGENNYLINVSAFPRKMVEDYYEVLSSAGFQILAFEIEAQSLTRTFVLSNTNENLMLVDIGGYRTNFALVSGNRVVFTSNISNIGGRIMENTIAKSLNISIDKARKIKNQKGLIRSEDNMEVFYSIIPFVSSLKDEIRKIADYWGKNNKENGGQVDKVILCGGHANLIGLDEYLSSGLNIPIEVGDPWLNINFSPDNFPNLEIDKALRYGTAIGLALRGGSFPNYLLRQ